MSSVEFDPVAINTGEAFGIPTLARTVLGTIYQGASTYGQGLDGDVVINSNPFTLVDPQDGTKNLITNNVLQRDAVFNSLTIQAGCVLDGMFTGDIPRSIFCSGLFLNQGTLQWRAANAAGATGGSGLPGIFASSRIGQNGGVAKGTQGIAGQLGGGSHAAGNGTGANTGGAAAPLVLLPPLTILQDYFKQAPLSGGSSGGSGGGDGANSGGGGGAGGPTGFIATLEFDNTSGIILCTGGNGGVPPAGNCGGGAGGGGGALVIVSPIRLLPQPYSPAVPISASLPIGEILTTGGSGAAGVGTGTAGANGDTGNVFFLYAPS